MSKTKYRAVRWPDNTKWVIEIQTATPLLGFQAISRTYREYSGFSGFAEIIFFNTKEDAEEHIDTLLREQKAVDKGEKGEWKF